MSTAISCLRAGNFQHAASRTGLESGRDPPAPPSRYRALVAPDGRQRGLVLVVEDEPAIADVIRINLIKAGYGVHTEGDGGKALDTIRRLRPAAIILDVGLPGLDGVEICRRLRAADDWTPVIFATARDDEVDRIVGLELGADDYVTKPFSPRELVARVTGVLRRTHGVPESAPQTVGRVTLDAAQRRVHAEDGTEFSLTATEFDLLAYLMRRPGRVFTREQ
jgi:DNA-binding response OmpR family regulator